MCNSDIYNQNAELKCIGRVCFMLLHHVLIYHIKSRFNTIEFSLLKYFRWYNVKCTKNLNMYMHYIAEWSMMKYLNAKI